MQTWEWGEVKALTGWEPVRIGAVRDGQLVGAVSLLLRRLPYLKRPLAYGARGPVGGSDDPGVFAALVQGARDAARERGALLVKLDPPLLTGSGQQEAALAAAGFRRLEQGPDFDGLQPRFVWQLPLTGKSADQLMSELQPKTRYNIGLARRKGVKVRLARHEDDLRSFYSILKLTAQRQSFMIRGYSYYQALWRHMVLGGLAELFLAEFDDEVISGTMVFKTGRHAWYVYGASGDRHRNKMPNYLLQWAMIEWALAEGCSVYDFRGVSGDMDPQNPLYGLYRFKRGFGGQLVEYVGEYDCPLSPLLYGVWTRGEPAYRRLRGWLSRMRGGG